MATSTIYFYQNSKTRKALAKIFSSVEDLDRNHKAQVKYIYEQTTFRKDKKQRLKELLNLLKTYSVCEKQDYLGVCFLSIKNIIIEYTNTYKKKISERAIQYLLSDLEELGFIEAIATKRESDNRQSSNIYRTKKTIKDEQKQTVSLKQKIREKLTLKKVTQAKNETNPVKEVAHKDGVSLHPKKAHPLLKAHSLLKVPFKRLKQTKERNTGEQVQSVKSSFYNKIKNKIDQKTHKLLNFVPKNFKELFSIITSSPKETYEYWQTTKLVCYKKQKLDREETIKIYEEAFREFFQHYKAASKGKFNMINPVGFYTYTLEKYASAEARRKARQSGDYINLFDL